MAAWPEGACLGVAVAPLALAWGCLVLVVAIVVRWVLVGAGGTCCCSLVASVVARLVAGATQGVSLPSFLGLAVGRLVPWIARWRLVARR